MGVLGRPGRALQFATTDRRFHFLNLHKYGREGQLLCHIWGDADWTEHRDMCDRDVVATVVQALRAMFQGLGKVCTNELAKDCDSTELVTYPAQAKVTRWGADP